MLLDAHLARIARRCFVVFAMMAPPVDKASAAPATTLILTNNPCEVQACPHPIPTPTPAVKVGQELGIYVAARDADNARDIFYTGTVSFSSSDPAATLPSNYTFVPLDEGGRGFTAILRTAGQQTITVRDVSGTLIPGTFTLTVTGSGLPSVNVPMLTPIMQILLALLLGCVGMWLFRAIR